MSVLIHPSFSSNGNGNFVLPDGSWYEGEIKDGRAEGIGELICFNGTHKGSFKAGKLNEKGCFVFEDGTTFYSEWVDGENNHVG